MTIGYLNINSIRNKFDPLRETVSQNLDILIVVETNIDDSFPKEQFYIERYADPLWLDRDGEGGGLLVYMKSDITMRQLKSFKFELDMECNCFEINLRGKKWALFSIYRPPSQSQDHFFENLGKAVDHNSEKYDNFLLIGDFNTVETDQQIRTFINTYDLKNLVKEPTCSKADNPCCIDLILTNRYRSFQHTTTFETGLSDFHKMIVTVLKTGTQSQGLLLLTIEIIRNFRNRLSNENLRKSWTVSKQLI